MGLLLGANIPLNLIIPACEHNSIFIQEYDIYVYKRHFHMHIEYD
jgi:hypothetical protein